MTTTIRTSPTTVPVLFVRARQVLAEALHSDTPAERFRLAHLAALRTAAVLLAVRGRPASARRRLISVWVLLDTVAPEYDAWTTYFAAAAPTRAAIEAGATTPVTPRMADDLLRAADEFLVLVESSLGLLAA